MKNFIPKAFPEEEDSCPVCLAKTSMEAAFKREADAIQKLLAKACNEGATTPDHTEALLELSQKFYEMYSDFRVSLAINLGIWFSAERYGRAKRVVELLMACDEYRERATQSLKELDACVEKVKAQSCQPESAGYIELHASHDEAMTTAKSFWGEIDKWNNRRRDEVFSVI